MEDIVHGVFAAEQQQVPGASARSSMPWDEGLPAARRYYLDSPEFSKFNDKAPLKRQGVDLSNRIEQDDSGSPHFRRLLLAPVSAIALDVGDLFSTPVASESHGGADPGEQ